MTISSSLNAGVMGLSVNATRLATISDNIANSATYGYKRSDVDFSSMVINQRPSVYSAGGVRATSYKNISDAGSLISTGNSTDISVNGGGMIPVTNTFGVDQSATERDFMLVPTGSFSADERGNLRTLSGLFLLGWPADTNGEIGNISRDNSSALVPVNIDVSQFTASPTRSMSLGINLPAEASLAGASGDPFSLPVEYFDNLGRGQTLTYTFTPNVSAAGPRNQWSVEVIDGAGDPLTPVATFDISFNDTAGSGGSIDTITPGAGATYDPVTGELSFAVVSGPMTSFLGRPNSSSGITQLAAPFSPYNVTKDGAPIGDLQSVDITEQGFLQAVYNSGFRRTLYQIPVADVPNMNGLDALNDQAFAISSSSGDVYLWDAGTGPAGDLTGYALMESTTDIASELTSLIETQRAYSSNAKIIQTVDEMLQETTNIKR
ncbi:MAG: flagellar hook-basal body complex protein [Acidimicrobiales bacterium]|nr:flagellar hook-basal body complex protein [Hyphomonadaceae bacterium]RZV44784.1 MAG: flagellar hook-basal body complex protein [Acidimicrobiales bacterium]